MGFHIAEKNLFSGLINGGAVIRDQPCVALEHLGRHPDGQILSSIKGRSQGHIVDLTCRLIELGQIVAEGVTVLVRVIIGVGWSAISDRLIVEQKILHEFIVGFRVGPDQALLRVETPNWIILLWSPK